MRYCLEKFLTHRYLKKTPHMPLPSAETETFNTLKDWITGAQLRGRGRVVMNCVWRMGAHGNRVSNTMSKNSHHTSSEIQANIKRACELGLDGKVFEIFHFQEFADRKSPTLLFWQKVQRARGVPLRFPVTAEVFQLFHEAWKHLGNAKAGRQCLKIVQMIPRGFKRIASCVHLLWTGN